jgi:hypothetical protein
MTPSPSLGAGMNTRKVVHVRNAGQTRNHTCHWPGCEVRVPPAKWGCPDHWYRLPKRLRVALWHVYVPGQEITLSPSETYLAIAREIQDWIAEHGAAT